MIDPGAITHLALAVADLEATMARLGAALELRFAQVVERPQPIATADGVITPTIRFTYSIEGPPHLELIAGPPGTVWQPAPGIHHIGVWSDDLSGDAARLEARGMDREAAGVDRGGRGPVGFSYHRAHGTRIELVDVAARPLFERWLAGDRFG